MATLEERIQAQVKSIDVVCEAQEQIKQLAEDTTGDLSSKQAQNLLESMKVLLRAEEKLRDQQAALKALEKALIKEEKELEGKDRSEKDSNSLFWVIVVGFGLTLDHFCKF